MVDGPVHAVTGAFGYSDKYIAQRLLDEGQRVITLTNSPNRANPFGARIKAYPFNFDQFEQSEQAWPVAWQSIPLGR